MRFCIRLGGFYKRHFLLLIFNLIAIFTLAYPEQIIDCKIFQKKQFKYLGLSISKLIMPLFYLIEKKLSSVPNEKLDNAILRIFFSSIPDTNISFKKLDIFVMICIIFILFFFYSFIFVFDSNAYIFSNLFNRHNIQILFLSLFTKCIQIYRIYINHIIGHISFAIFTIILDIIIIIKSNFNFQTKYYFYYIILAFLFQLCDVIEIIYQQYLMYKKFISRYKVCGLIGMMESIAIIIIIIINFNYENFMCLNGNYPILLDIKDILKNINIPLEILKVIACFLGFVITNFIYINILYYFNPCYLEIYYIIYSFIFFLINNKNNFDKKDIIIFCISFIFLFISLSIYLEFIELNFCGLNENTIRYILEMHGPCKCCCGRRSHEHEDEDDDKDEDGRKRIIELDDEYIIDFKTYRPEEEIEEEI